MSVWETITMYHDVILDHVDKLMTDLTPLTEKSVFLHFPEIDKALQPIGDSVGFDVDMLKYVLAMFLAYPLALILDFLPGRTLKHTFSLVVGLWFTQQIFQSQWVHSFISSLVTYLICLVFPRKLAPGLVFTFTMLYISLSHLYRIHVDYLGWSLDFTGPQMILTIKLSSFAYNLADGEAKPPKEGVKNFELQKKIYSKRQKLALKSIPNPLFFFGYVYNFTTFLAGPAFEYQIYADAIDSTSSGKRPSGVLPGLYKLLQGVVCMGLHVVGSAKFPIAACYGEKLSLPFFDRWLYSWIALFFIRLKYHFAWKVAEGSCNFMGMGFQGYDEKKKPLWEGVSNMDIIGFETAGNTTAAAKAWNKGTQKWLQEYVYLRLGNSLLVTYFTSAFWHGFYPGYYLFFFSIAFVTIVTRQWQKTITPRFSSGGSLDGLYSLITIIGFSIYVNYYSIVFQVLAWEYSVAVWKSLLFLGHIITLVAYVFASIIPAPKSEGKKA